MTNLLRVLVLSFLAFSLVGCGTATGSRPDPEASAGAGGAPDIEPACHVSNTAPGCTPSSVAWVQTCDAPVAKPAVWCTLPEEGGDSTGAVWCC